MASIGIMIGGALFSAVAFAAANYGFSKIDPKEDPEQTRQDALRHSKAMEDLAAAKEKWAEERAKRADFLAKQAQEEHKSDLEAAEEMQRMKEYYEMTNPEPKLSDFYQPSQPQKDREILFIALGMPVVLILSWKLL